MITQKRGQWVLPLLMLSEGEEATVAYVDGGLGIRKKLTNMGIIPGKKIRIFKGAGPGPRVVIVDETKIMIGHGMLHRIFVEL